MADAQASGACGGNIVWVQVPSPAFFISRKSSKINGSGFFIVKKEAEKNRIPVPGLAKCLAAFNSIDTSVILYILLLS